MWACRVLRPGRWIQPPPFDSRAIVGGTGQACQRPVVPRLADIQSGTGGRSAHLQGVVRARPAGADRRDVLARVASGAARRPIWRRTRSAARTPSPTPARSRSGSRTGGPGSPGDDGLADVVETRFRTLGLETSRQRFFADVDGEEQELSNVIGRLRGRSDREVVIMAHRDSAGRPGAASASGNSRAARAGRRRSTRSIARKTIVFVSTDGATADDAGARRFADHYRGPAKVDVALVLDDIGATVPRRPFVVPWSTDSRRASQVAARTVEAALRRETGSAAGSESWLGQFDAPGVAAHASRAGPAGALRPRRGDAHRRGASCRGRAGADPLSGVSADRLTRFGRAGFAAVLAFDSPRFRPAEPNRDLVIGRNVLPSWSLALLAAALTLPALVAAFDAVARARRRRAPVGDWIGWALGAAMAVRDRRRGRGRVRAGRLAAGIDRGGRGAGHRTVVR